MYKQHSNVRPTQKTHVDPTCMLQLYVTCTHGTRHQLAQQNSNTKHGKTVPYLTRQARVPINQKKKKKQTKQLVVDYEFQQQSNLCLIPDKTVKLFIKKITKFKFFFNPICKFQLDQVKGAAIHYNRFYGGT